MRNCSVSVQSAEMERRMPYNDTQPFLSPLLIDISQPLLSWLQSWQSLLAELPGASSCLCCTAPTNTSGLLVGHCPNWIKKIWLWWPQWSYRRSKRSPCWTTHWLTALSWAELSLRSHQAGSDGGSQPWLTKVAFLKTVLITILICKLFNTWKCKWKETKYLLCHCAPHYRPSRCLENFSISFHLLQISLWNAHQLFINTALFPPAIHVVIAT